MLWIRAASVDVPTAMAEPLVEEGEGGPARGGTAPKSPSMAATLFCSFGWVLIVKGGSSLEKAVVWLLRVEVEASIELAGELRVESGGESILRADEGQDPNIWDL